MGATIGLCGASGAGKSTLAAAIKRLLGDRCSVVSTSSILRARFAARGGGTAPTRDELFAFGEELNRHEPSWLLPIEVRESDVVVIDAIRSGGPCRYLLPHLVWVGPDRPERWFEDAANRSINSTMLAVVGDADEAALDVLERMYLSKGADCVIGAQWGSEGKGKVAAYLSTLHAYSAMGRSGGPNAGHRVELPDGKFFVFRHLPSASPYAKPGTKLCIGPGAVVDLEVLERELPHVPPGVELVIDPRAVVVTDRARQMEREHCLTEIGSTMSGTGGAAALRVMRTGVTFEKLGILGHDPVSGSAANALTHRILEKVSVRPVGIELRRAAIRGRILLESTQGIQLSLFSGEYPKVTSRDVSASGLLSELGLPPDFPSQRWYLVARTYPIRVSGPSGNLPGEVDWERVAATSGRDPDDLRAKERTSVTNRLRRVAEWVPGSLVRTVRRSFASHNHLVVAITFADYLDKDPAALAAILREAKQCSPFHVLVGFGPKTSDVRLEY